MGTAQSFTNLDDACRVLHVDDDEQFVTMSKTFLEADTATIEVVTETDPRTALDRLEADDFECIVSDFDMPHLTGLEFLRTVKERTDIPFILFTGKGSEEIASDAISAGVTDYIQKETGTDQYTVLANRIVQVVEKQRVEQELERRLTAIEAANDGIGILNADGEYVYLNKAYANAYGYTPEELVGTHWRHLYPDEEIDRFIHRILPRLEADGRWHGTSVGLSRDGDPILEELSLAMLDDGGHVCVLKERETVHVGDDVLTAISLLRNCLAEDAGDVEPAVLDAAMDLLETIEHQYIGRDH